MPLNIICTVFGGTADPNNSAYEPYAFIDDDVCGVALPWKFTGPRPRVRVLNRITRRSVVCEIVDLGPWLTDDNYVEPRSRPLAETCWRHDEPLPRGPSAGTVPNGAGIDLTPGAAAAIGIDGKGVVDWDFVPEDEQETKSMAEIVISSGHGAKVRGASGYIDEVDEARRVVDRVAAILEEIGVLVSVFHDDVSDDQDENLERIVDFHNSRDRELDVSVHFNAYETTDEPMGTECLYVTQVALAELVADEIARAGGLQNRGAKYRDDLYFLNNTDKPAILIEVCFVDSLFDSDQYDEHFESICKAIAATLANEA